MKSYIEPLNAADALDVLYAHGIPFGDISYSRDNDEDAVPAIRSSSTRIARASYTASTIR